MSNIDQNFLKIRGNNETRQLVNYLRITQSGLVSNEFDSNLNSIRVRKIST